MAGLGLAASAFPLRAGRALAAAGEARTSVTADEALGKLKAGNARYVTSPEVCAADLQKRRDEVAESQAPWATIVGCSDSRAPPELLFGGLGVGEIFVARNPGNMVDTTTMGAVEYGAAVFGVPLIIVLGHERCGAVTAALQAVDQRPKEPAGVQGLVKLIEPGLPKDLPRDPAEERLRAAIEANVRWSLKQLATLPEAKKILEERKTLLVGAYYELSTGKVKFLSD